MKLQEKLTWDDFSSPESDSVEQKYLPAQGEGDSFISQAVTATCKLIYKWFNDGDVFDNTHGLVGWANDLSSYANWLDAYVNEAQPILERIRDIYSEYEYTQLLYDLMQSVLSNTFVEAHQGEPKVGSIYECSGPYKFQEESDWDDEEEEEDDDWY